MPTEADLRARLRERSGEPGQAIDVADVLRRARRRRLSRQIGLGAGATLAAASIVFGGIAGLGSFGPLGSFGGNAASQSSTAEDAPAQDTTGQDTTGQDTSGEQTDLQGEAAPSLSVPGSSPADRVNLCGATIADIAPNRAGLTVVPEFAASPVGVSGTGTVALTNTGPARLSGTVRGAPAIAIARDGIVLWHSTGGAAVQATAFDLGPGETLRLGVGFDPVLCTVADDGGATLPDGLPSLPSGDYAVAVVLEVVIDGGSGDGSSVDAAGELVIGMGDLRLD